MALRNHGDNVFNSKITVLVLDPFRCILFHYSVLDGMEAEATPVKAGVISIWFNKPMDV